MPRRPAAIGQDIPLFLVPLRLVRGDCTHGEDRERVIVRRARFHFSTVSIRSRPIRRELKRVKMYRPGTPEAVIRVDGEDARGREGLGDTGGREGEENNKDGGEREWPGDDHQKRR